MLFRSHSDYRTTLQIFGMFETWMNESIVYWQYIRSHYTRDAEFPELSPDALKDIAELFFDDPRLHIDPHHSIRLD